MRVSTLWIGALASVLVHLVLGLVLLSLPPASTLGAEVNAFEVEFAVADADRPTEPPERLGRDASGRPIPLRPGGGHPAQNVDALTRGESGDSTGARSVVLLFDHVDAVTLFDSPMTHLGVGQTQRIRTANSRATQENRRATPNPNDQVFLATGPGAHPERRPVSARDAREGARIAPAASELGGDEALVESARGAGRAADGSGRLAARVGAGEQRTGASTPGRAGRADVAAGGPYESPGVGIVAGRGARASEAARVAHARPPVDRGPAATNAERFDPRIRDDRDAELLAASVVQSWVEASQRSAPEAGAGRGGVGGGGAPGSGGGRAEGGRSSAYGPGNGSHASLDTSDSRYLRWHLSLRRRVYDRLVFPRARALAMDQGWSVYRFDVGRDGALVGRPRLVRSSGFGDLDRAARRAIERAAPFPALPSALAHGIGRHTVDMRIEHSNPMVQ